MWDYDIDEPTFLEILAGRRAVGRLDRRWAATRLLEYAPWSDIVRLLGYRTLVECWPTWRSGVRSVSRRRGLDFVVEWLPRHHPELIG